MNLRKMIRSILTLLMASFVLIGCGGSTGSKSKSSAQVIETDHMKQRRSAGESFRRNKDGNSSPTANTNFADEAAFSFGGNDENSTESLEATESSEFPSHNSGPEGWGLESLAALAVPFALANISGGLNVASKGAKKMLQGVRAQIAGQSESEEEEEETPETETEPSSDSEEAATLSYEVEIVEVGPHGVIRKEVLCQTPHQDEFGGDIESILETAEKQ